MVKESDVPAIADNCDLLRIEQCGSGRLDIEGLAYICHPARMKRSS